MKDICKSFNGIPVLKQVQLTIEKGEVHALLGENGAGKSTLMNILAGVFPADSGEVEFNEKKIRKMTIQQSEKLGIAFVHQELNLFKDRKSTRQNSSHGVQSRMPGNTAALYRTRSGD